VTSQCPRSTNITQASCHTDKKGDVKTLGASGRSRSDMRKKKPIMGTIVGVLDGALDGVQAQLMRRTKIGSTVQLLESKDTCRTGESVHLSRAAFTIHQGETP